MDKVNRNAARRTPRLSPRWCVALWSLVGLGIIVDTGCTVTKDNYATLSFFFDGVPDPNTVAGGAAKPGDATLMAVVSTHAPFAQDKCDACHKTQYRPSRNDGSPCLACHQGVLTQHNWTHGAVAGGACLWCHSPHESARRWLLRGPDRKVCAQCHAGTMLDASAVPAHVDESVSCVSCHFGHGGDDSLMLKPGASATTTAPDDLVYEKSVTIDPTQPAPAAGDSAGNTESTPQSGDTSQSPEGTPANNAPAPAPARPRSQGAW